MRKDSTKPSDYSLESLHGVKELVRADARVDLLSFALATQSHYNLSWHHNAVGDVLMAAARGEIPRLIITMPPQHGKSALATISFPAWYLGLYPDRRVVVTSYSASLAQDFGRDFRRIVESEEYQKIFPQTKLPGKKDSGWVNRVDTVEIVDHRGAYRCTGVGGALTGKSADLAIIDDPIKNREEAYSPTYRERVYGWYQSTLRTRIQGAHSSIIVIMTRWHQDDLVGRLLRMADESEHADQWQVLELPAIKQDSPNDIDPREPGEALWPARYNVEYLEKTRAASGETLWESLYQCNPTSVAGEIIRREWLKTYRDIPPCDKVIQAWDLNFGKTAKSVKSSYVAGQCWGRSGSKYYLLESIRGKWTHTENKRQVMNMRARWDNCQAVYIEDAASGAPLIDDLKGIVPGLIPVKPDGSKVARFEAVAPLFEAGQIYIPERSDLSVREWVEEIVSFPGAPNDDQADAAAMALSKLSGGIDYSSFRAPEGGARPRDILG